MSQRTILIVDDNADHRHLLAYRLRKLGESALLMATNGQEALEVIARHSVQLIFMNLRMPVLSGLDTIQRIRALQGRTQQVPIIAHTAYVGPGQRDRAMAVGCDAYLSKPVIDMKALQDLLERLLSKDKA